MNPWIPHLLRASGGGGGSVLPPAGRTMLANLTSSLILNEGAGNPTHAMSTAYWKTENDLGLLRQYPAGSAFFGGARLVRNLVPTPSNTLAVAGTKTVTLTQAATLQFSMGAGAGTATFSGTGGATGTLAAGASRVRVNKTVTAGTFIVTASVDALVDLSIVDVTGYDASYVPEYVSVGVVSSPFFGAGIDGAKYFETDWQGAPIAEANLKGFLDIPAATNNVLLSRDLQGPYTNNTVSTPVVWISSVTGSEKVVNGTFDSDIANWTKTGSGTATFSSGKILIDSTAGLTQAYQDVGGLTIGAVYQLSGDINKLTGATNTALECSTKYNSGSAATRTVVLMFTATAVTERINLYVSPGCSATFDNVSVKQAGASPKLTATGIDGIANSATRLTFVEANAVIKQALAGLGSSTARCTSAYIKLGTPFVGPLSMTQDDGATWVDVTSQLNSSTYVRPQITSTLANPIVGFKSGTAGDVVDVDVVQNEAGTIATPPIVTTTATVSRGASSLTYQTASNWSDTAGTAFIEAKPESWPVVSGGAIGSATNGLLLSSANSGATAYDGTNAANGPVGAPSGKEKLAMRWTGAVLDVASSGAIGTAGIYDGAMGLPSIAVGAGVTVPTYFKNLAIYSSVWTDDEIKANVT